MRLRGFLRVLVLAALLPAGGSALAEAPATKPVRILFIGNSLTDTGDTPGRLAKLAAAMGRTAQVDSVTGSDYSLADHWREGRAQAELRKGWDFVILQQGASARAPDRAELIEYAQRFSKPIREAGARAALYMVWPVSDRMQDFRGAIAAYRDAAQAVDGIVIPVGEAWLRALSADKRLRLYGDTIHPSSLGVDLAVITIYLTLFPAGPQEFDEAFVAKIARVLELPPERRDPLIDAATRAIDEPMRLE
jgi:hypothetical protein